MTVTASSLSADEIAGIETVTKQLLEALRRRDFDGVAALYTEDAELMPPHQPAIRDRSALKAWWAALPPTTAFELTFERVDGRADLAYVRGAYTMTLQPEGAPAPVIDRGKYLDIRRRQPDGAWLVELSTFNSDLP